MPEFSEKSDFKETIIFKFKESALKAFLGRASRSYSSFSLKSLESNFELPEKKLI